MALLLPEADGIADHAAIALPESDVFRYGEARRDRLNAVTFYCLPYMGDAASVALIGELPGVRVVQSLSSGVDDVLGAVPPQATLCNGHGLGHEEGTADLALTLILASLRQIPRFVGQQSRREWSHLRTESLDGSRVSRTPRDGVFGLHGLPALAATTEILVVCIALHPATCGLIGQQVLASLPNGALVVNVARGPVVDAAALSSELHAGRLRAALDVTDPEPLPSDRPEWTLPN